MVVHKEFCPKISIFRSRLITKQHLPNRLREEENGPILLLFYIMVFFFLLKMIFL